MPLEDAFRAMMTDTVTIEPYIGQDLQNKPSYGPALSYWARLDERVRLIRDANGNQVVSMSKVSTDPTTKDGTSTLLRPPLRSRITLPGGRQPIILSIATSKDLVGVHHYVFYC